MLPKKSFSQFDSNISNQNLSNINSLSANTIVANQDPTNIDDEFLPVDEAYQLSMDYSQATTIGLNWKIAEGYYLYRHSLKFILTQNDNSITADSVIPNGLAKVDDYFGNVEVYYNTLDVTLNNLPMTQDKMMLQVTSQGCADAGLCYPPRTIYFQLDSSQLTITEIDKPANSLTSSSPNNNNQKVAQDIGSLPYMLFLAVIGGIILNLMPCVFPVLSLKVLAFANDKNHSQPLHGISYTIGVIASFIFVAAILISLRAAGEAVGWGFHLQSPTFVAILVYLFFLMGLSLSGAIEIGTNWMNIGGKLASQTGYTGSFFTGVLATVVASPCTAPLMGTALGFAITQTNVIALSVFAALGFGMALPMLCLSFSSNLLNKIPKPGKWMDQLKQLMAFPLYATAIWLCWVIGKQVGVNAMAIILAGCVLIFLTIWLWTNGGNLKRAIAAICAAFAISIPSTFLHTKTSDDQNWITYSPAVLNELRQQNRPVFINITADWCITCLANEKVTLDTQDIKQALVDKGFTYLKGDWTNYDPVITNLLEQYGRTGIPLYLVYPANGSSSATVLPQILTKEIVLKALDKGSAAAIINN